MTEQLKRTLTSAGIPAQKAETMTRSVGKGLALILVGLILLAVAVGTPGYIVLKLAKEPSVSIMLFAGFALLAAVYFLVAGGNIISGQALDHAGQSPLFGIAARAIRYWKPKP